jgi:hypothetical protein
LSLATIADVSKQGNHPGWGVGSWLLKNEESRPHGTANLKGRLLQNF